MPEDVAQAQGVIRQARRDADVVVVVIHWGVPPAFLAPVQAPLADYQRPLARALVEAGADAIVVHHPHVVHGVELIDGKPVFYSLGNFVFHRLGSQLVVERPSPPYNWNSMHGRSRAKAWWCCFGLAHAGSRGWRRIPSGSTTVGNRSVPMPPPRSGFSRDLLRRVGASTPPLRSQAASPGSERRRAGAADSEDTARHERSHIADEGVGT